MTNDVASKIDALERRNRESGRELTNLKRLAMMLATGIEPNSCDDMWVLEWLADDNKDIGFVSAYTGVLNTKVSPVIADNFIRRLPQADRYDEYLVDAKQRMTNYFNGVYDE